MNEELANKAAMYLEEIHISGDAMIELDHNLGDLPYHCIGGSMYLHDVIAGFVESLNGLTSSAELCVNPASGDACPMCEVALSHKLETWIPDLCPICKGGQA